MFRLKLTNHHFFSGEISDLLPLETSIEMSYNMGKLDPATRGKKTVTHKYYKIDNSQNKHEEIAHTEFISEEELLKVLDYVESFNLKDFKNNYFSEDQHRFSHWELEYDYFKIVGTYDQVIEPYQKISDFLGFEDEIQHCIDEVNRRYS